MEIVVPLLQELREEVRAVRADVEVLRGEMRELRGEMRGEMRGLQSRVDQNHEDLAGRMDNLARLHNADLGRFHELASQITRSAERITEVDEMSKIRAFNCTRLHGEDTIRWPLRVVRGPATKQEFM